MTIDMTMVNASQAFRLDLEWVYNASCTPKIFIIKAHAAKAVCFRD